ncbi:MAG: glycosyltransferase family 1 protein [Gemmatimonadales bacterium]|jgi:glycosyltransferase involved in cell wall biosynthesis
MSNAPIAFDVTYGKLVGLGTGVYIWNLLAALEPRLGGRLVQVSSRFARRPRGARRTRREQLDTVMRDLWWHQAGAVVAARRRGAALLHMTAGLGPVAGSFPTVATIHDVMPIRFAPMFRPWYRWYAAAVMPRLARRARAVITVSEAAKREIVEWFGVAPERIAVIPHGVDPLFTPLRQGDPEAAAARERYSLPPDFVLAVGSVEPRKNLTRLLEAVRLLRERPATREIVLVHAGPEGWRPEEISAAVSRLGLDGAVRLLGYVPAPDLRALFGLARGFVYPSLWEGFGLPVLEAMACGCPVVASGVASIPEVAGDAALLVDPQSVESIADGIAAVWDGGQARADLVRRGLERAGKFTWERAAGATIEVYEAALG